MPSCSVGKLKICTPFSALKRLNRPARSAFGVRIFEMALLSSPLEVAGPALDPLFTPGLVKKVQEVLEEAEKTGARVAAWDTIQALLLDAKVSWRAQVPPEFVGVHPQNRSRLGVGGSEAHFHGAQVLQAGWSWRKASDATAIACPPPPLDREPRDVNAQLTDLSDGLIPPLEGMRLLSIGGGHTNTFLRAVKANCRTTVASLQGADGRLSKDLLCAGRPGFKEAVENGLQWCVLHHQAPEVWPGLVHLVQAALNTHAKSECGEVEVLLDMSRLRDAALAANREPDWKQIEAAATFTLPPCSPYIEKLSAYVRLQAPELVQELGLFQKAFACAETGPSRALGGEYFGKLCSLSWGAGGKFPYLLLAAAEANLQSQKVVDGICKLISPAQLSQLTAADNRENAKAGERLMTEARRLCRTMNVPEAVRVRMVGKVDVRVVCFLTKTGKQAENRVFSSIGEISKVFAAFPYPYIYI